MVVVSKSIDGLALEWWTERGEAVEPLVSRWSKMFGDAKALGRLRVADKVAAEGAILACVAARACEGSAMDMERFDAICDVAEGGVTLVVDEEDTGVDVTLTRREGGEPS